MIVLEGTVRRDKTKQAAKKLPQVTIEPPYTTRRVVVDEAVLALVSTYAHGAAIERSWLEEKFGIVYPAQGERKEYERLNLVFVMMFEELRESLLTDHQMALTPLGRGRYRIARPEEHEALAQKIAKSAIRKGFSSAMAVACCVRTESLTATQAASLEATRARLAGIAMFASRRVAKALPAPPSAVRSGNK